MAPLRVLFLTHNYPRTEGDAAGSFVYRLATALRAEDVEVRVVAPATEGVPDHEDTNGIVIDRFRYAPRRFETLAYGGNMASQVKDSWGAKAAMIGFLGSEFRSAVHARRAFEPDVIHAHWWFPNGLVGTWLQRMADKPLVTTLHGTDVRLARAVPFARPAFRHVMAQSAAVTAVSRWLADEAKAIVNTRRPVVAPMPVATEYFSPGGTRAPDRLLFVGRLNQQKGIATLIEAMGKAKASFSLDVIGDGADKDTLVGRAAALGLADRIRWHAGMRQPKLAEFYRNATALVVPSVDEGLGLVAVEAQLCETPVVAFTSGGLTDVVQHDRTGILVGELTADGLARAIDDLFARADRGVSMGAAGRLSALSTFAPESSARRYADIYRAVANGAPSA